MKFKLTHYRPDVPVAVKAHAIRHHRYTGWSSVDGDGCNRWVRTVRDEWLGRRNRRPPPLGERILTALRLTRFPLYWHGGGELHVWIG